MDPNNNCVQPKRVTSLWEVIIEEITASSLLRYNNRIFSFDWNREGIDHSHIDFKVSFFVRY